MNFRNLRLIVASVLVIILVISAVNLFAAPWRNRRLAQVVARVEQALCYEQPATAERLMTTAAKINPGVAEEQLRPLRERSQTIQTDMAAAREFFAECGNQDRVAVIDDVTRQYSTPKEALERAVALSRQGEAGYAQQLLKLATSLSPDYSGLEEVRGSLAQ